MLTPPTSLPTFRQRMLRAGILSSCAAGLLLGFAWPSAALAGNPKLKPRPPFKPPYDVIQSVDVAKKTIVVSHVNSTDHTTKTYTVSNSCDIEVSGNKAQLADLKAGLKVSVGQGSDVTIADRIVAGPAPLDPREPAR